MSEQNIEALDDKTNGSTGPWKSPVATLEGIGASQAMIEFELDGTIITANENFLAALGYELSEIEGKHHGIFVDPAYKKSREYRQFWDELRAGEFQAGEVMRRHKSGQDVWLQAAYNPVLDADGKPYKVVKTAVDITEKKLAALKNEAKVQHLVATLEGIGASQSMIEFELDGTIITANENFLAALGYELSEIEGKHHGIFVDPAYKKSREYRQFWDELRAGEFQAGEVMRRHKSGQDVWLQATYNPVLDVDGKPYKVVKTAVDITEKKLAMLKIEAETARQARDILELSTPVISVWQDVLVQPLIGTLDSRRMQECMEKALTRLSEANARVLILDITGVPVIDSMVANHLMGLASSVRLMGGHSIITGISPSTAMTIVGLGIDLSTLNTRGTLEEGLKLAMELIEGHRRGQP